jgi:hypothetical protein
MTHEELTAKFDANSAGLLAPPSRAALAATIGVLDTLPDASELLRLAVP